ncbi:hypothetical protein GTW51_08830 [Aurantimonas aggregata]|uniref:Methyltransferase domain-containing protein n=1 Tax=Aurantimonas aggregata TaxID=2047720 RepID=A0A6L9MGJ7_9HYPH|nr:class I SAM-dependent methyltransferase [Aurantimonas aggregata]NDV86806.1 hypothetical protein [Aurantimonas aggregata]
MRIHRCSRGNITPEEDRHDDKRHGCRGQEAPYASPPGGSTAPEVKLNYRLGKLKQMGLLRGVWLDCGCADGGHTEALVAWGSARAIGVDREQSRIGQANLRKQENDPTFAQSRQQEDLHNVDGINDAAIAVFSLSD